MVSTEQLLATIVEGMQEKKAKRIITVDMTSLDAPCKYFAICEGDSSTQVNAIATSVRDQVRINAQDKPIASTGYENNEWIALDYGSIMVHIFQRPIREFYDIEHLWADATLTEIPDLL